MVRTLAALLAVSAAAGGTAVSQTSIGPARLGLTQGQYATALKERPAVTHYADGTTRLAFTKAQLLVELGRNGRGRLISTEGDTYKLRGGIGPCGSFAKLAHAFRLTPHRVTSPLGNAPVVYQLGHLWLTTVGDRIGSVSLASGTPDLQALINLSQCGTGEEEGSG